MKRMLVLVVVLALGAAAWKFRSQVTGKARQVPIKSVKDAVVDSAETLAAVAKDVATTARSGATDATTSTLEAARDGARRVGSAVSADGRSVRRPASS